MLAINPLSNAKVYESFGLVLKERAGSSRLHKLKDVILPIKRHRPEGLGPLTIELTKSMHAILKDLQSQNSLVETNQVGKAVASGQQHFDVDEPITPGLLAQMAEMKMSAHYDPVRSTVNNAIHITTLKFIVRLRKIMNQAGVTLSLISIGHRDYELATPTYISGFRDYLTHIVLMPKDHYIKVNACEAPDVVRQWFREQFNLTRLVDPRSYRAEPETHVINSVLPHSVQYLKHHIMTKPGHPEEYYRPFRDFTFVNCNGTRLQFITPHARDSATFIDLCVQTEIGAAADFETGKLRDIRTIFIGQPFHELKALAFYFGWKPKLQSPLFLNSILVSATPCARPTGFGLSQRIVRRFISECTDPLYPRRSMGINLIGRKGSGKSTFSQHLKTWIEREIGEPVGVISSDAYGLYLSRSVPPLNTPMSYETISKFPPDGENIFSTWANKLLDKHNVHTNSDYRRYITDGFFDAMAREYLILLNGNEDYLPEKEFLTQITHASDAPRVMICELHTTAQVSNALRTEFTFDFQSVYNSRSAIIDAHPDSMGELLLHDFYCSRIMEAYNPLTPIDLMFIKKPE